MEPTTGLQPLPSAPYTRATEASPLNAPPPAETVLVLSAHAKFGRYVSVLLAATFLLGFHVVLVAIGWLNRHLPCERPLPAFLIAIGLVGIGGSLQFVSLEVRRNRDEALLLPTETPPPASSTNKVLVLLTLVAALVLTALGGVAFAGATECAFTSPVVFNWTLAALLLYVCFGGLVVLVPVLGAAFPVLSVVLLPLIAALVAFTNWLSEAGKRGAFGAASVLRRWLMRSSSSEPPAATTLPHPSSTFALYVNTAAILWLFGFMAIEVVRSWRLPCDAPLHAFVIGAAGLGLAAALADFVADVFRDPMPPVTKVEQSQAKEERKRKLQMYAWVAGGVVLWGALGLLWVRDSETCAHTAPGVYRLALLLCVVYALFIGLLALALLALAVDFCLSGKLRMVVILEQ